MTLTEPQLDLLARLLNRILAGLQPGKRGSWEDKVASVCCHLGAWSAEPRERAVLHAQQWKTERKAFLEQRDPVVVTAWCIICARLLVSGVLPAEWERELREVLGG
jgi:hypothetical protein